MGTKQSRCIVKLLLLHVALRQTVGNLEKKNVEHHSESAENIDRADRNIHFATIV